MENRTLKIGLIGNAIFSFITGLALIIAHDAIALYMGIADARILIGVGIALLPFALQLLMASRRAPMRLGEVYYLSALDGLWVLGSVVILLSELVPFTTAGSWLFALVAVVVADFMLMQMVGARKLRVQSTG